MTKKILIVAASLFVAYLIYQQVVCLLVSHKVCPPSVTPSATGA